MCMKPTMTEEERILTLEEKVARLQFDVYAMQNKIAFKEGCDECPHAKCLYEADRKTENSSEKPNNCEDLQDWKDRMWAEAIVTEPTISKMEQVDKDINVRSKDEPQTCETCKWGEWYRKGYDITMMDDECGGCCSWRSKWTPKDEPQTERSSE